MSHVHQAARTLASDITERGARLYDLLAQEGKLQQARAKSLRFLDSISSNLQSTSENEYIERSDTNTHTRMVYRVERGCGIVCRMRGPGLVLVEKWRLRLPSEG